VANEFKRARGGPSVAAGNPTAVADRLRPLLVKLGRELRREAASLGLTGGQAALLHAVRKSPGIGVRELAQRERVSAPAMSGYVDRLEAAGYLTRTRLTGDRRRVGLDVTARGERILRSVRSQRTAWLSERLGKLSAEELIALEAALDPLRRVLEDEESSPSSAGAPRRVDRP